jgi:AcrR family transcriptional regulator
MMKVMKKDGLDRLAAFRDGSVPEGYFGNEKKWEIVKAAAALFIKRGTVNTGVREIAEASGITVGTLYHYFKSKDEIISAFLDFAVQGTDDFVHQTIKVLVKMQPEEALRRAIQLYIDYVNEAQNIVLFWHQETRNLPPGQRDRLLENEMLLASLFEKLVERGRKSGIFTTEDSALAAHNIIVLGDMWAFRRWWLGRRYTSSQYAQKQAEFILRGLRDGSYKVKEDFQKEVRGKK